MSCLNRNLFVLKFRCSYNFRTIFLTVYYINKRPKCPNIYTVVCTMLWYELWRLFWLHIPAKTISSRLFPKKLQYIKPLLLKILLDCLSAFLFFAKKCRVSNSAIADYEFVTFFMAIQNWEQQKRGYLINIFNGCGTWNSLHHCQTIHPKKNHFTDFVKNGHNLFYGGC